MPNDMYKLKSGPSLSGLSKAPDPSSLGPGATAGRTPPPVTTGAKQPVPMPMPGGLPAPKTQSQVDAEVKAKYPNGLGTPTTREPYNKHGIVARRKYPVGPMPRPQTNRQRMVAKINSSRPNPERS